MRELTSRVRGLVWLMAAAARAARLRIEEQLRVTLAELEQRGRNSLHARRRDSRPAASFRTAR